MDKIVFEQNNLSERLYSSSMLEGFQITLPVDNFHFHKTACYNMCIKMFC